MGRTPLLLDRYGNPVQTAVLKDEIALANTTGTRSPLGGYPADGLTPERLAQILRAADYGDPVRYLELAQTVEERDLHYIGVLGTRRRSVSQLDITVEAGSSDPKDEAIADRVRTWLKRDELTDELFDILDAIGKGYSFTEIIWDTSSGQWEPTRLEYRDPRWFRFDRKNLTTPLLINDSGAEEPLAPYKFICAKMKAKSGIVLRAGLARIVAWAYMFKKYTERDWAIFTQTYGQPLRVGKYGTGASKENRDVLFKAVANIAGDCAAIIPEGMEIEFIQTANLSAARDLYSKRADWLDQQVSKAVLGQTATTDAVTGGLGSGEEHREVQKDIEGADAKALAAVLNQDLIRPWVNLEFGAQKCYPKLKIARPDAEDLTALATGLEKLVPLGMKVSMAEVRGKYGLSEPKSDDDVLTVSSPKTPDPADAPPDPDQNRFQKRRSVFKSALSGNSGALPAKFSQEPSAGDFSGSEALADLTARLSAEAALGMEDLLAGIEELLAEAPDLATFREMMSEHFADLDTAVLSRTLETALMASFAGGRASIEEESGG